MKRLLLVLIALTVVSYATLPTVTVTEEKSGMKVFSFSFTTSAIGTGDTAIVVPSGADFFTADEWNQFNPSIYYLSTGETTVDSVRFDIVWQGKGTVNGTWRTLETVTADSSLTWNDVFAQETYGRWAFYRILILSGDAKTSVQTLTGEVLFKRDVRGSSWF